MENLGLKMDVEFIQLAPPTTAAIKMIKGPWVLQQFSGSWIFKPHLKDKTNAKFVYAIKTNWWSIPYLSEFLAIWYFRKIIELRMQGLKRYCEAVISNSQERPMC
jgi:hypothetical protein